MVSAGPGGCLTDVSTASKRARVSAGESPLCTAISLVCNLVRLNPDASSLGKNAGGVIFAVAVMWATTSRTVHSLHNEGMDQRFSSSVLRSTANALRSAWTTCQMSISPPPLLSSSQCDQSASEHRNHIV